MSCGMSQPLLSAPSLDMANLRRGVDVVCATPGRLRDHIQRKSISLEKLEFLVLDEADEMLKVWKRDDLVVALPHSLTARP